jgi:hypothetical protein
MEDLKALELGILQGEPLLPWDRLSAWVHGICVVTFDLELGQAIESIYPEHVALSEGDKSNICYLAFPDSNSGLMGDSQFHFRIRVSPETKATGHLAHSNRVHSEYNRKCPPAIAFDPKYLFGYVYFRQVKDSSIRRGYYQKSVILLSKLPLVTFFPQVTSVIARKFFECSEVALEAATKDLDSWSLPAPGHSLELPLMGHLFQLMLPSLSTRSVESGCESVALAPSHGDLLPAFESVDLFLCLLPVIEHAHCLWELVLTAEPLVVMASNPSFCSATVQYLTSLIYPLNYAADYRPFYTIHDSDFKEITATNANSSAPLPNILLGVTNPFFGKALKHWPHIVKLGDTVSLNGLLKSPSRAAGGNDAKQKGMSKFKMDAKAGLYSAVKPFLDKDKAIVKRVHKGVQLKRPNAVQSALIRRHFLELTQTFMIPLERYLASLMPLAKNISPYRAAPKVKPFNPDEFLRSLDNCGPHLTSTVKGDWEGLYRRFFKSPNFVCWYNLRHREVAQKLQLLHLESLAESRIEVRYHKNSTITGLRQINLTVSCFRIG